MRMRAQWAPGTMSGSEEGKESSKLVTRSVAKEASCRDDLPKGKIPRDNRRTEGRTDWHSSGGLNGDGQAGGGLRPRGNLSGEREGVAPSSSSTHDGTKRPSTVHACRPLLEGETVSEERSSHGSLPLPLLGFTQRRLSFGCIWPRPQP